MLLTFKQRMMIFAPIFILGMLGIFYLPEPYNKFAGFATISLYWIIIMIFDKKYENEKKKQNK